MWWWVALQAVAGVAAIVWLVDAGMDKDSPLLVKLGFVGAFVATWLVSKVLDFFARFQGDE